MRRSTCSAPSTCSRPRGSSARASSSPRPAARSTASATRPARESDPCLPLSPYGAAKLAGEGYLGAFARLYGTPHVALRFGNVYGPRQDPHGEAGVVAIFLGRLRDGSRCRIFGDGSQTPRLRLRRRRRPRDRGGARRRRRRRAQRRHRHRDVGAGALRRLPVDRRLGRRARPRGRPAGRARAERARRRARRDRRSGSAPQTALAAGIARPGSRSAPTASGRQRHGRSRAPAGERRSRGRDAPARRPDDPAVAHGGARRRRGCRGRAARARHRRRRADREALDRLRRVPPRRRSHSLGAGAQEGRRHARGRIAPPPLPRTSAARR